MFDCLSYVTEVANCRFTVTHRVRLYSVALLSFLNLLLRLSVLLCTYHNGIKGETWPNDCLSYSTKIANCRLAVTQRVFYDIIGLPQFSILPISFIHHT